MICTVYIHNRSYIWASCHISKASRIARMILVFFMYDPIKTETWLIFHLWFLQYSSIQPNGFYDIRMKKVSRHNKKGCYIVHTWRIILLCFQSRPLAPQYINQCGFWWKGGGYWKCIDTLYWLRWDVFWIY